MSGNIFDKLRNGEWIRSDSPDQKVFLDYATKAGELRRRYNQAPYGEWNAILSEILGKPVPENTVVVPPFHFDIGTNISLGRNVIINYDCVLLDDSEIDIGDNVLIGPGVKIVTATHPLEPELRYGDYHYSGAKPVTVGKYVWIGAGAIILPGITVGEGATVGAGAVVTHDV